MLFFSRKLAALQPDGGVRKTVVHKRCRNHDRLSGAVYFMAGSRINTLSDWLGKAVGNVYGNGSSSDLMPKPDKTVGNVYNSSSSVLMPKPIIVIVWTKFWSEPWWLGDGTQSLRTCPEFVGQCEFTRDHSRLKDSDVLVFHMNDKLNLPRRHFRHQKWVFSTVEPPPIVKRANFSVFQYRQCQCTH